MSDELAATLQTLSTLTRLDLSSADLPSLRGLTQLQQLRHLGVNKWDLDWPSDEPAQLPAPARFAALQSYNSSGAYVYGGLQLGGFRFQMLAFEPLPRAADSPAAEPSMQGQSAAPQPGTLRIDGCLAELDAVEVAAEEAPADEAPLLPQLHALLEAALPPRAALRQLVLECCALGAVSLQHLPVLGGLHRLQVRQCWGTGSMDGPLQALVQRAPALTSLTFDAQMPEEQHQLAYRLHTWPAYLLAHPSLRSAALFNRHEAGWDLEEARPPSAASAHSVLEELETDSCASVPPQLAAATSLTGLRFVTTSDAAQFELTASGLDALLALPRLTSLSLPRLSEGGQRAAEQLRSARPGLRVLMNSD